jgi:membrane protease YdiL (CAAX protease family)
MTDETQFTGKRLRFEPNGFDFPFYRGAPISISFGGWLAIISGVAAGFAAMVTPMPFPEGNGTAWAKVAAFVILPLLGLGIAARAHWKCIFASVGLREVKLMFGFAFLNIVVTMAIGGVIKVFGTTASNAIIANATELDGPGLANFFAKVAPQLLGEELITILPFLAILTLCHRVAGLGRNKAVIIAWLVSALVFGLLHLPTYDWNLVQCIVVIGSARLILTWAYIRSKNIWVSTGAHIINDWVLMASTIILTPLAT